VGTRYALTYSQIGTNPAGIYSHIGTNAIAIYADNKGSTNSSCNIKRQETHRLQIWQFVIADAEQLMERFWQLAKPV
jgi:hypothetical protein